MFKEGLLLTEASGSGAADNDTITSHAFVQVLHLYGLLVAPQCASRAKRHLIKSNRAAAVRVPSTLPCCFLLPA